VADALAYESQPLMTDALVLGGGPAGVAAALALHDRGLRVEIVERTRYADVRLGETLPPAVQVPLAGVGLWDAFLAQAPRPAYGLRSYWGAEQATEHSFLFDPYGNGWQVDRRLLDSRFAQVARARGIRVTTGARATFRRNQTRSGWEVDLFTGQRPTSDGPSQRRQARWLVVATGRRSPAAGALGTRQHVLDHLMAVAGFMTPNRNARHEPCVEAIEPAEPAEPAAVIEAVEDGWWYSAPLPDGRLVAMLFTDPDICGRDRLTDPTCWAARLSAAPETGQRMRPFTIAGPLQAAAAGSACLVRPAGPGWVAVGDRAQAHDPLSGNGVGQALDGGRRGAVALAAADCGDSDAFADYAEEQSRRWTAFTRGRAAHYAMEGRWPLSTFWHRRRADL
jgi:2-polyprenyl-6-methoxyphenol hydroxylase-like FAD-dependent oxidoreductase